MSAAARRFYVLAWSTVADRSGAGSRRFINCLDTRKVGHNERRAKRGGRGGYRATVGAPSNGNLHARTTAGHRALKREPRLAKPSAAATHRRRRHEQLPVTPLCFTFSLLVSNHDRLPFLGPCERSERGARGGDAEWQVRRRERAWRGFGPSGASIDGTHPESGRPCTTPCRSQSVQVHLASGRGWHSGTAI